MKEKSTKITGLLIAAFLLMITIAIAFLLPKQNVLDFFLILLSGVFPAYLGFALSDSTSKRDKFIEFINIGMGITLSLLSVIITPYFLVAGWFWHGLWDAIHHKKILLVKTDVPEWYIYGCTFYDWAVAIFLIWWLSM